MKTTYCNTINKKQLYCPCAVGVVSGRSHYIYDRCNPNDIREGFFMCEDKDIVVTASGSKREVCVRELLHKPK